MKQRSPRHLLNDVTTQISVSHRVPPTPLSFSNRRPGVGSAGVIDDSALCLLHLLLLAELFANTSSRPTRSTSLCHVFQPMTRQLDSLLNLSKKLHDLTDNQLLNFDGVEHRLHSLPHITDGLQYFGSLKVNESFSRLYLYTESFRMHADWLKTAQENVSMSFQSANDSSTHLLQLSNLLTMSLHQIQEEVPQSPSPTLPVVSNTFEVLQFSVEFSGRLQVFCDWAKRVLRSLQSLSRCPKR